MFKNSGCVLILNISSVCEFRKPLGAQQPSMAASQFISSIPCRFLPDPMEMILCPIGKNQFPFHTIYVSSGHTYLLQTTNISLWHLIVPKDLQHDGLHVVVWLGGVRKTGLWRHLLATFAKTGSLFQALRCKIRVRVVWCTSQVPSPSQNL